MRVAWLWTSPMRVTKGISHMSLFGEYAFEGISERDIDRIHDSRQYDRLKTNQK